MPTTILLFTVYYNISVTTVYNEVISNSKFWFSSKPWRLILTIDTRKAFQHLCWNILFYTSVEVIILPKKEHPILKVMYPCQQEITYIQVLPTIIAEDCIGILVLYYLLLEYSILWSYSLHTMWDFIKNSMISI